MEIRGVIFDLDGTLADTMPVLCEAFRRTFDEFLGLRYSDEEIVALFGPTEAGVFQKIAPDRWQECLDAYHRIYGEIHNRCPGPFPGIEDALKLLKARGTLLAVVTGKGPRTTEITLGECRLAPYFGMVETGSPDGSRKGDSIEKVVARWSIPPKCAAYIGDAASDIDAAREGGVVPLGAAWSPTASARDLRSRRPLAVFEEVGDFIDWLEGVTAGV